MLLLPCHAGWLPGPQECATQPCPSTCPQEETTACGADQGPHHPVFVSASHPHTPHHQTYATMAWGPLQPRSTPPTNPGASPPHFRLHSVGEITIQTHYPNQVPEDDTGSSSPRPSMRPLLRRPSSPHSLSQHPSSQNDVAPHLHASPSVPCPPIPRVGCRGAAQS